MNSSSKHYLFHDASQMLKYENYIDNINLDIPSNQSDAENWNNNFRVRLLQDGSVHELLFRELEEPELRLAPKMDDIKIYPNPTPGFFTLETNYSEGLINVYSSVGNKVYETYLKSNSTIIDGSKWAPGVYFIELTQESGKKKTLKIFIQ